LRCPGAARPGRVDLVAVDLGRGCARDDAECVAIDADLEAVVAGGDSHGLAGWIMPTWMRWVATMMEPRCETRRWTMRAARVCWVRGVLRAAGAVAGRDGAGHCAQGVPICA